MSIPAEALPAPLRDKRQLDPGSSFRFDCRPGNGCFTRCCSDVNIVLTPADVLELSRRSGLSTREFLDRYTLLPVTRALHLPVVMLKMGPSPEKRCPFVGPEGCSVYEARPWACRMYPIAAALPPARAGLPSRPAYFLCEDDFCEGRNHPRSW
ncbi:MAG TPA: YkgJ family cysteine cluster protein, partial [Myxococcales bacterium]|nr:YkgJ family cysteine cluster protein [Myxococcales bacterium]